MKIVTIEEELKKNPQLKQQDIDLLREWTVKEKCAPEGVSDIQLALFLHSCDYCMETTKQTIKANYLWRAEQPFYFTKRNPELDDHLAITVENMHFLLLPKRTSQDEVVIVVRLANNDPKQYYCAHTIKLFFMMMDVYLLQYGSSKGLIFVYDCEPISFSIARKVDISSLKALFFYLQDAIPFKLSAVHFMNMHPAFDFVFSLFKPFIKGSLLTKMFFHKAGSSTVFAHLAPNSVPKLFNGEEDSSLVNLHAKSKEMLQSFEPWFEKEELALKDFMEVVGTNKKKDDPHEVTDSFRKLDFD